jgi:hypothetical protein
MMVSGSIFKRIVFSNSVFACRAGARTELVTTEYAMEAASRNTSTTVGGRIPRRQIALSEVALARGAGVNVAAQRRVVCVSSALPTQGEEHNE